MTALQDWLTLRPVDQSIRDHVLRPLRAALTPAGRGDGGAPVAPWEFTLQQPGIERC